jgi:hypothetical protein
LSDKFTSITGVSARPAMKLLQTVDIMRGRPEMTRLLLLLYHAQEVYSTDPRDKIFALIGLLEGQVGGDVPFYAQTTARAWLMCTLILQCMCYGTLAPLES